MPPGGSGGELGTVGNCGSQSVIRVEGREKGSIDTCHAAGDCCESYGSFVKSLFLICFVPFRAGKLVSKRVGKSIAPIGLKSAMLGPARVLYGRRRRSRTCSTFFRVQFKIFTNGNGNFQKKGRKNFHVMCINENGKFVRSSVSSATALTISFSRNMGSRKGPCRLLLFRQHIQ